MDNSLISKIEFEKFKKELHAMVDSIQYDDNNFIVLACSTDKEIFCEACGKTHKGMRILSKANDQEMTRSAQEIISKVALRTFGADDNKWGKPKEN